MTNQIIQITMQFSPEDGAGALLFYVSPQPIGQGDNYGKEGVFPDRLAIEELDAPPKFSFYENGEGITLKELLEKCKGWACNVSCSWDSDGVSSL